MSTIENELERTTRKDLQAMRDKWSSRVARLDNLLALWDGLEEVVGPGAEAVATEQQAQVPIVINGHMPSQYNRLFKRNCTMATKFALDAAVALRGTQWGTKDLARKMQSYGLSKSDARGISGRIALLQRKGMVRRVNAKNSHTAVYETVRSLK